MRLDSTQLNSTQVKSALAKPNQVLIMTLNLSRILVTREEFLRFELSSYRRRETAVNIYIYGILSAAEMHARFRAEAGTTSNRAPCSGNKQLPAITMTASRVGGVDTLTIKLYYVLLKG